MPDITRRIRIAKASYSGFKRELYDTKDAPITTKVRMLEAEEMEALLYG